jgi:two-component system sensor histidine kinase PilS (NtrC family)
LITVHLNRWRAAFGLGVPPSAGAHEALQWLMLARLFILYVLLAVIVLHQVFRGAASDGFPFLFGYAALALCFAFNLANACLLPRLPLHWWVAAVHVVFDAAMTSAWIYFSDGRETLFALLYLIQILAVALILFKRGAILAAAFASLSFGLVIWHHPPPSALLVWSVYTALFLMLGLVGGYLSEELLATRERLKDKSRKMERLMALHERILADLPTGLLTVDREMRINFINPAGENILNCPAARAVGRVLSDVEPGLVPFFSQIRAERIAQETESVEDSVSAAEDEHHRTFLMEEKADNTWARLQQCVEIGSGNRLRILRGDVAELEADAGLGNLLDKPAPGARVLLFQDVTKLLQLEERLKQNEKLAAVGQLAAGIAHEIRNPLASMSASIEMLKGSLRVDQTYFENQKLMDIAIREIDRLNRLISEFLDFVKPEKLRFESVALDKLLAEIVLAARRAKEFNERVTLRESYAVDTTALANGEKLRQVIWNLIINAMQAMNKPGQIEIGCSSVNAQRVSLWVQDQGQGMSEASLSHLYEPFFTTKEKGTGLGLATAYKIIEAHHGEIKVKSSLGAGTRFEVVLPKA